MCLRKMLQRRVASSAIAPHSEQEKVFELNLLTNPQHPHVLLVYSRWWPLCPHFESLC